MGKKASKEIDPNNGHKTAETINLGIINASSNSFSENIPIWEIVEIVSLAILILLVIRWARKWFAKRKMNKTNKQREQMALAVRSTKDIETQPMRLIPKQFASLTDITNDAIVSAPKMGAYDQYR
jgi:hypothetical protein